MNPGGWFDIKCPSCGIVFPGKKSYLKSKHKCANCSNEVNFVRVDSQQNLKKDETEIRSNKISQNNIQPNRKSLTNCPDCGNLISKNAKSCPKCGVELKKTTGCWGRLLLILFILFIFSVFMDNDPKKRTPTSNSQQSSTASVKSKSKPKDDSETYTELGSIAKCREVINTIWYVAENAPDVRDLKGTRGENIHIIYKNGNVTTASCSGSVLIMIK